MNLLAYIILAEQEFDWIQIVVILIVMGVGLIGSIYQKFKEQQQQDGARKSEPSGHRQRQIPAPRTVRPARPVPPPAPGAQQTVRVSEELRLRQQRQVQLESDRQKRLGARISPEYDTNAIEARLVSVHPDETDTAPMQISKVGVILQLKTRAETQKAIILHEIFSPPKALRKGGDIWDS